MKRSRRSAFEILLSKLMLSLVVMNRDLRSWVLRTWPIVRSDAPRP